jgi:Ferritin-like
MRFSMTRHLGQLTELRAQFVAISKGDVKPFAQRAATAVPEFDPVDYVTFLLYIDAELEHSLMIQYLYGAYSLGGPQVPEEYQEKVSSWQEIVLGIAKEEMAHLVTVQNVLRLIGAPLNFGREDYPWDTPFLPYPFMLEPLTPNALAKYIFAESPLDWSGKEANDIKKRLPKSSHSPHKVAELFEQLIELVKNSDFLPDEVFQAGTWPFQAKWNEWGRGYQKGRRGDSLGANPRGAPDLLVLPAASRDDAVHALQQIAEQGEACPDADPHNPSHFARFLLVYQEMTALLPTSQQAGWAPWRNVAINPYIPASSNPDDAAKSAVRDAPQEPITNPEAIAWGHLFNVRYRMVLTYLTHSFELAEGINDTGVLTPRGIIISATFGEMYNLRAIANCMVQTPLSADSGSADKMAGPPFQMPYMLNRPTGDANRWRQHRSLLLASQPLVDKLLTISAATRHHYLNSLREADQKLLRTIDHFLAGH